MPLNIRFFVGRREIIRSLGTHDLKVARRAVIEMADELDKLFSKIQMGAELLSSSDLAEFSNAFCASKTQALLAILLLLPMIAETSGKVGLGDVSNESPYAKQKQFCLIGEEINK